MTRGVIQDFVIDDFGNKRVGATVEVRLSNDNSLAVIYDSIAGGAQIANPTTTDADGLYKFYAEVENYNLIITAGATTYTLSAVPAINADELSSIAENAQQVAADAQQVAADKAEVESDRQEVAANTAQVALDAASAAQSAANAQVAAEAGGVDHVEVDFATANANVGTYANGDTVLVLSDENYDNAKTYYEVVGGALSFIGLANALDTLDYPHLSQNKPQSYWLEHLLAKVDTSIVPTPSLDLDFENGVYKVEGESKTFAEAVTYTRSSLASAYKASTKLDTAVAIDTPQFEYDPETGERYLLLEPSRTNEVADSEGDGMLGEGTVPPAVGQELTDWIDGNNISVGYADFDASSVSGFSGSRGRWVHSTFPVSNGEEIAWSVYVQLDRELTGSERLIITPTGSSGLGVSILSASSTAGLAGQWFRVSGIGNVVFNGTDLFFVHTNGGITSPVRIKLCGFQAEKDVSYPTSYIKTTGSTVTRAAPSATVPVGEWFNPNEGTFVVESRENQGVGDFGGNRSTVFVGKDLSNRFGIVFDANFDAPWLQKTENGSASAVYAPTAFTGSFSLVSAFTYSKGGVAASFGGSNVVSLGAYGGQTPTLLDLSSAAEFLGRSYYNQFKSVQYYPKALNEAQLKALTSA